MAEAQKLKLIDGWEVVIGIEIHTQLATNSKIFSGSSTEFGQDPNTQASLVDLAMPGVLPVLNEKVVELAIRFGLGIDAYIDQASVFARKNYFYPDSPKGYQISQMDNPIVGLGHIDIQLEDGTTKRIGVTRAHLEEDAGKSVHDQFEGMSGIDLNRAGTPLLEIVSEPDMRSVEEAVAYIKAIHTLVRWLGISDGNMAEGSFRADCNVSLRRPGQPFGTRCELKTSTHSVSLSKRSMLKLNAKWKFWNGAAKLIKKPVCSIQIKWKRVLCVLKKKQMTTATSLIQTCYQ